LILNVKKGSSLLSVKRDYQKSNLSLNDTRKLLYKIVITEKLKGKSSSWASHTSFFYKKGWLIETGFSDLNRINRRWKSNYDSIRYLDMSARKLLYYSWKINKTLIQKRNRKKGKMIDLTLTQNQDCLEWLFISLEKNPQG
jgi:hypothetical protein